MTVGQAISILDANTRIRALAAYEYYGGFNGQRRAEEAFDQACKLACDIMKEWSIEHCGDTFEKEYECVFEKGETKQNEE